MDKKILGSVGAGIIIVIAIAVVGISPDSEPKIVPKPNEKIGLVINTPSNTVSLKQLDQIYSESAETGIGRSNVYLFWNIIEPEKDQYNWEQSDILMSLNEKNNLAVTLYFSVINGETLGPFPSLIGNPPIQSISKERVVSVLDAILTRYDIIDSLIIAGQAESQFRYSKQNIPVYNELFNDVYSALKSKHPDIKIGNSFALNNVINKNLEDIVKDVSAGDFVAFSYMPVDSLNDIIKTPEQAKQDLEKITKLVPDGQIGLFEISWSSSDFVGGSDESQSEFLEKSFDFYSENKSHIEFMTWYRVYDRPVGTCVTETSNLAETKITVGGGSGLGSSEFVIERLDNYICKAGLKDVDGKPKPAWDKLKNQIELSN